MSALAQVDRETFDSYYAGRSVAFALGISSVWEYKNPPSLSILRKRFPQFVVPQSWRYLRDDEHRSFCRMNRLAERTPATVNCHGVIHDLSGHRDTGEAGNYPLNVLTVTPAS